MHVCHYEFLRRGPLFRSSDASGYCRCQLASSKDSPGDLWISNLFFSEQLSVESVKIKDLGGCLLVNRTHDQIKIGLVVCLCIYPGNCSPDQEFINIRAKTSHTHRIRHYYYLNFRYSFQYIKYKI